MFGSFISGNCRFSSSFIELRECVSDNGGYAVLTV